MALKLAEAEVAQSPVFDLRRDIHRFLLEGMAQQDGITFNVDKRKAELFAFLKLIWSDEAEGFLQRVVDQANLDSEHLD